MGEKILRLHMKQPTAHYRVGFTQNNIHRTYPLPPPSTVLGMIHNIMGCKTGEIIKGIDIAIVGKYENIYYQYQLLRNIYNPKKQAYKEVIQAASMPVQVQLLLNMDLYIYIKSDKNGKYKFCEEERDFEEIVEAFENPHMPFILGRREDIAIAETDFIKTEQELNFEKEELPPGGFKKYNILVSKKDCDMLNLKGVGYLLNTYYKLDEKTNSRNFKKRRYVFVEPQDVYSFEEEIKIPKLLLDKTNGIDVPIFFLLGGS
jgi:CRISPR-associated protein Cas5t